MEGAGTCKKINKNANCFLWFQDSSRFLLSLLRPSATGAWVSSVWGPITSHLGRAKNVLEAVKTNGTLLSLDCAGQNAQPAVHSFHSTEFFVLLLHTGAFMTRTPLRSFLRRTWSASFLLAPFCFPRCCFLGWLWSPSFHLLPLYFLFFVRCRLVLSLMSASFSSSLISFIALLMRFSSLFRVSLLMLVMICSLFLSTSYDTIDLYETVLCIVHTCQKSVFL
jgi:hypothetical protein